jgi:hypothetical protein
MNPEELGETAKEAHEKGNKKIGLTTAIVAVILAVATLLGHRAHTEEIVLQTKVNDGWAFYQAKHSRAYQFALHAEDALRAGSKDVAERDLEMESEEECGVPAEKGCALPLVKKSTLLKDFIKDKGSSGASEHAGPSESATPAHEGGSAHSEKPAKEGATKDGAVQIQEKNRDLERETEVIQRRAGFYDGSELFLEISIVLCAIALLADQDSYWKLSFLSTAIGIGIALWGWFLH